MKILCGVAPICEGVCHEGCVWAWPRLGTPNITDGDSFVPSANDGGTFWRRCGWRVHYCAVYSSGCCSFSDPKPTVAVRARALCDEDASEAGGLWRWELEIRARVWKAEVIGR